MSSNPTTLEIENSNIPEGACVLPPNTSEGWAVAIHAAACRCVVLVNIDHTKKKVTRTAMNVVELVNAFYRHEYLLRPAQNISAKSKRRSSACQHKPA